MVNGFKIQIDGYKYIAKGTSAHDSNDATNPDTPRKSFTTGHMIIGSGVYNEIIPFQSSSLRGDGKVLIVSNTAYCSSQLLYDVEIIGIPECVWVGSTIYIHSANNCTFRNCTGQSNGKSVGFSYNCIYINCNFSTSTFSHFYSVILISTQYKINNLAKNSYADFNSLIIIKTGLNPSLFLFCNIQGLLSFEGNSYAIQDQLTGTPQDNGYAEGVKWLTEANLTADGYSGTISGWDAAVATCMNRNPMFNNPSIGDYSLQAGSPMVGAAENGIDNIGGTRTGITTLVNQNGVGNIEVIPSPEIDTTNPLGYVLADGETEGYIDFIEKIADSPEVLDDIIVPISDLLFDADYEGGSSQNRNVIDSHPRSADYPQPLVTTAGGGNTTTLKCTAHGLTAGKWIRVQGQPREITDVPDADTITVGTALRGIVGVGVPFQAGTEAQLAALNPNRLTYEMRTSTQSEKPTSDAEWDNSLDPMYGMQGVLFTQEWFAKPELVVDLPNVYGGGDTDRPIGVSGSEISCTWRHIRVFLRNDYRS